MLDRQSLNVRLHHVSASAIGIVVVISILLSSLFYNFICFIFFFGV